MQKTNEKISELEPGTNLLGFGKNRVYLDFYNLNEAPFSITPDPDFLFLSGTHLNVIDKIIYGINGRMGFTLLIGEVGTGKTTICRSILDRLNDKAKTVYIINPALSGKELISSILDDLGIKYSPDSSKKMLIDTLNQSLISDTNLKPAVIIIDDAQAMPPDALEDLRLLSNLETDKSKLLQILLVGQPELEELTTRPEMRQLRQRIAIRCQLDYLTREEIDGYITRRLFIAGDKGRIRFSPKAITRVHKASRGIPRLINKICDFALTAAYVKNDFNIGQRHIKTALSELEGLNFKTGFLSIIKPFFLKVEQKTWVLSSLPALAILMLSLLIIFLNNADLSGSVSDAALSCARVYNPMNPDAQIDKKTAYQPSLENTTGKTNTPLNSYILQLASSKAIDMTIKAASGYQRKGIIAHWNRVDLGKKGTWYRLFAGQFPTKTAAEQFKKKFGLTKAIALPAPWSVLVVQSDSVEDLEQIRAVLRDNHYDSFTIKNTTGGCSLLSGAFISKDRAEKTARKINKIGFEAKAVEI